MMADYSLFCDGGQTCGNPEVIGGAYAWCLVADAEKVAEGSSFVRPADIGSPVCGNNMMEFMALCHGLIGAAKYPALQGGLLAIHTDSVNALNWWLKFPTPGAYPESLYALAWDATRAVDKAGVIVQTVLLAGHPSPEDLAQGYRIKKSGAKLPVSRWNKWCDEECTRLVTPYKPVKEAKTKPSRRVAAVPVQALVRRAPATMPALALASVPMRQITFEMGLH